MNISDNLRMIDATQVAQLLHCSEKTVYEKASNGELPGAKIGKSWTFRFTDIEQYLDDEIKRQTLARKNRYAPQQEGKDRQPRAYQGPVSRNSPYPDLAPYRHLLKS